MLGKTGKEKDSSVSMAYKITNIEIFLESVDRDLGTLIQEEEVKSMVFRC